MYYGYSKYYRYTPSYLSIISMEESQLKPQLCSEG
jgi:hypothetical protein